MPGRDSTPSAGNSTRKLKNDIGIAVSTLRTGFLHIGQEQHISEVHEETYHPGPWGQGEQESLGVSSWMILATLAKVANLRKGSQGFAEAHNTKYKKRREEP